MTAQARLRYWSRRLARRLTLEDGTPIVTLLDAATAIERYFSTVTASKPLEAAIEALMTAARTGKRADVAAASEIVERTLATRYVLKRD